MKVRKLSDIAGAEIEDINLSRPRSPALDKEIAQLFDTHGLLVFRDQKLTKQQLLDIAPIFGGAMIDIPAVARDPEVPGVLTISTRGPNGDIMPEDPEKLLGDVDWHTDHSFATTPTRGKMLYAVQVPEEGGMTGFIDGCTVYRTLADDLKMRIEDLHVISSWTKAEENIARQRRYVREGDHAMAPGKFPDIMYPFSHEHPITGEKTLNRFSPLYIKGIFEMPGPDGAALLEEIRQHAIQDKFQYWHRYRLGDALIWDNWRFIHAANGTPGRYPRMLYGITLKSGPVMGSALPTGVAHDFGSRAPGTVVRATSPLG